MKRERRPYICLPGEALGELADRCAELGPRGAEVLRRAGTAAGAAIFRDLGAGAESLAPRAFWKRLEEKLRELNLGSVRFEPLDGRLGALAWYRLPEAGAPAGAASEPDAAAGAGAASRAPSERAGGRSSRGCHFATGVLEGVLGAAAGRPIGVLEIGCGVATPHACWFLVGSRERLATVERRIAAGASVAEAVRAA